MSLAISSGETTRVVIHTHKSSAKSTIPDKKLVPVRRISNSSLYFFILL
jgi:hypothetical protein